MLTKDYKTKYINRQTLSIDKSGKDIKLEKRIYP